MATFYLDLEGGNDSNDGTSFANRWRTFTTGATAARIAPGDVIRVMGSPAPTSIGSATWSTPASVASVPSELTSLSIASSTNASPIELTFSSSNSGLANGDTIAVNGHTTNTNANGVWEVANVTSTTCELVGSTGNGVGSSGSFRRINPMVVRLNSALTATIASTGNRGNGRTAWTQSANVTASLGTTLFKEGDVADSIAVATGFTTGLAAYKATGALDLSGYKQVSFWIMQTAGTVAVASDISLRLCSDAVGAVSVQTVAIPALVALNVWEPITVNIGSALPASVQSIAFYVDTDRGAQTFLISNIIACKDATSADSLTLRSLIGKNTAGETFFAIQSINGTRVVLDSINSATPLTSSIRGYSGTSETVTTYKRETIQVTSGMAIQDSGTAGSLITFSGGWDRTNMSTQNLETWMDGRTGSVAGLTLSSLNYVSISNFSFVRYSNPLSIAIVTNSDFSVVMNNCTIALGTFIPTTSTANTITIPSLCNNSFTGTASLIRSILSAPMVNNNVSSFDLGGGGRSTISSMSCSNNNGAGLTVSAGECIFNNVTSTMNLTTGITVSGNRNIFRSLSLINNTTIGLNSSSSVENRFYNLTTSGSGTAGVSNLSGRILLFNSTISESTEFTGASGHANGRVISVNHDATPDNHYIYTDGGVISSESTVRHTDSGIAWKFSPTLASRTSTYPLGNQVAIIPVVADVETTVSCWFRRSSTNLEGRLLLRGGQIPGASADVTDSITVAADTWEELSISFTPTESGVVVIEAEFYASDGLTTYNGYIDDMSVSPTPETDLGGLDFAYINSGIFGGYPIGGSEASPRVFSF